MSFNTASPDDIKAGRVTDVYFERVKQVLDARAVDARVVGEVRAAVLPRDWSWAVLAGIDELAELMCGLPVDVETMPEGTVFAAGEPAVTVAGRYRDFAVFETALLGVLCQASGVATMAARCKLAAEDRPVYSFGARRMHPACAPMIERNAYVGGCDGVAVSLSAERLGTRPVGTMAHAFILVMGDPCAAYRAFDEVLDDTVPRIALIDTLEDEKFGAVTAAECLGDRLAAVRLDTPQSRRGDFAAILRETRWELDLRGFDHVKIVVSGGLDEAQIAAALPYADSFGVGTAISNAPVVDFSFDLVEVEGRPRAKRGKESGTKQSWHCTSCFKGIVVPRGTPAPACPCGDGEMRPMLAPLAKKGEIVEGSAPVDQVRDYVRTQLLDGIYTL